MTDEITRVPLDDLERPDREETVEEADRRLLYIEVRRMLQRYAEREIANAERDAAMARMETTMALMHETVRVLSVDRAIDAQQIEKLTMLAQAMGAEINVLREQQAQSKARVDSVVSRQEELAGLLDRMRARIIEWDTENEP